MELKDSIAISYLAEPEVLAVSVLETEFAQGNYYEILQKLNGSIKDDSFVEQHDVSLENSLPRDIC